MRRRAATTSPLAEQSVRPAAMSAVDLGDEAVAGLFSRPGRMSLTILGTVIGLGALVATLGLTRTANNRIVTRFDEVIATEVVVGTRPVSQTQSRTGFLGRPRAPRAPRRVRWDAQQRRGRRRAGRLGNDPQRRTDLSSRQAASPSCSTRSRATCGRTAVRRGAFRARRSSRGARPIAAERLGSTGVQNLRPCDRERDLPRSGILDDVARSTTCSRR